MKRIYRALLTGVVGLAFGATVASAQTIGFKAGVSLATMSIEDIDEGVDHRTGFAGGGFVRFDFGRLGIQPEILSVTKGFEVDDPSGDERLSLEYVAIPVLLHFPLTYGASFAPYLIGGPEFAFEVGCDAEIGGVEFDCDDAGADSFDRKSFDIGLSAGGGLAFAMGPGALLLEGRYTWGLTNIQDDEQEAELKNRAAYIMAGYSIPLGRRY
ncbi:MAG TPA: porin family protein [Longimicrobiales bacterium]